MLASDQFPALIIATAANKFISFPIVVSLLHRELHPQPRKRSTILSCRAQEYELTCRNVPARDDASECSRFPGITRLATSSPILCSLTTHRRWLPQPRC